MKKKEADCHSSDGEKKKVDRHQSKGKKTKLTANGNIMLNANVKKIETLC